MKKILIVTAMLTLIMVWSCKDSFLEFAPPPNQNTDASFFQTTEHYNGFLIGAYTELLRFSDFMRMIGYISQEARPKSTVPMILTGYMVATRGEIRNFWQAMYVITSRTNIALDRLGQAPPAISAAEKDRFEGEAKFLRGFGYFNIARAFGNAPLLLDPYSIEQTVVECTAESQIWDQVILDLTEASQKLPTRAQWGDANYGRATKGAALAFLANAFMYKKDWANAAKASQDLMALNEYRLANTVRSVYTEAKTPDYIAESIFEVQYRDSGWEWSNQIQTGNLMGANTAPDAVGSANAPFGGWGELVLGRDIRNSMEPNDQRRGLIVREGETYNGERWDRPRTLGVDFPVHQKNVDFSTKFWYGPGPDLNGANTPLMRYAEFLLNYAEILFEQGNHAAAYDQLNMVRRRAGLNNLVVSTNKETFMTALMNERRWELNTEFNLWFHYTRTGRLGTLKAAQGFPYNPNFTKFPIPQDDRDQNPKLCQNEGY